ncbi:MAG: hypothetical protein HY898_02790 [Deltaproteobacteria bacterium]|nr:hypothetical protein [Deltaproteobacteria bacterium]
MGWRIVRPLLCALAAALPMIACGRTATISRGHQPDIRGRIAGGDASSIYVRTRTGVHPIPRKSVTDIDHPGDGAIVVGAGLALVGILALACNSGKLRSTDGDVVTPYFILAPSAAGAALMIYGISVHGNSVDALDQPPPGHERVPAIEPTPLQPRQQQGRAPGLSLSATW